MRRSILLLLWLALAAPASLAAQSVDDLRPGDRLRVRHAGSRPVTGLFVDESEGVLRYRRAAAPDTIGVLLSDLARLEVARGTGGSAFMGGSLGLLMGAAAGFLWDTGGGGAAADAPMGTGAALGALGGLLLGAAIGAGVPTTTWVSVGLR